jgi:signal transduction histidine kinase
MDIITIFLILVIVIDLILVVFSAVSNKDKKQQKLVYTIYLINIVTVAWWVSSVVFLRIADSSTILLANWNSYISASFIASTFYYFTLIFPSYKKLYLREFILVGAINILLVYLIVFTKLIIVGAISLDIGKYDIIVGNYFFLYALYILGFFLVGFARLFKKYFLSKDKVEKSQILIVAIGYTISGIVGFTADLFMPWIHITKHAWAGPMATVFLVVSITYAVTKYKLFDIKVLTAELLIFVLWIFTITKISVFDNFNNIIINVIFLLLVIFVGILLIRGVRYETQQREKIEALAKDLEQANHKLKELDELKSEFISLATHHISSPLTAIRGYVSLLQETETPEEFVKNKSTLDTVQRLTTNTVNLVKDFLEVNRIDEGRVKYEFSDLYIAELLDQVVTEYAPEVHRKNLDFDYTNDISTKTVVHADRAKIKQAISNIFENSIKYAQEGTIKVFATVEDNKCVIQISDTGIRNLPTISPRLLRKLTQSGNTDEANIIGNGIGIYAAKLLIEANKGKLWIETKNGVTLFCIELPII